MSQQPNAQSKGYYDGILVQTGKGGGLASVKDIAAQSTYFHAARLPEIGDTVIGVTRTLDPTSTATTTIEIKAFLATAPQRGALIELDSEAFIKTPGSVAFAELSLARPGDDPDERGTAELKKLVLTDTVELAETANLTATTLAQIWESELRFGSWPAVKGHKNNVEISQKLPTGWVISWLKDHNYYVDEDGLIIKVLVAAWLEAAASSEA